MNNQIGGSIETGIIALLVLIVCSCLALVIGVIVTKPNCSEENNCPPIEACPIAKPCPTTKPCPTLGTCPTLGSCPTCVDIVDDPASGIYRATSFEISARGDPTVMDGEYNRNYGKLISMFSYLVFIKNNDKYYGQMGIDDLRDIDVLGVISKRVDAKMGDVLEFKESDNDYFTFDISAKKLHFKNSKGGGRISYNKIGTFTVDQLTQIFNNSTIVQV